MSQARSRFVSVDSRFPFSCFKCRKPKSKGDARIYDNDHKSAANNKAVSYCAECGEALALFFKEEVYKHERKAENPDANTGESAISTAPAVKLEDHQAALKRIRELEFRIESHTEAIRGLLQREQMARMEADKAARLAHSDAQKPVAQEKADNAPAAEPAWFEQIPPTLPGSV